MAFDPEKPDYNAEIGVSDTWVEIPRSELRRLYDRATNADVKWTRLRATCEALMDAMPPETAEKIAAAIASP